MPFFECAEDSPNYLLNCVCAAASCKKGISQKQSVCMCSSCHKIFHPPCKGIIGTAKIKKAAESNWICSPDCAKVPVSETNMAPGTTFEKSINSLSTRIDCQFADIKGLICEIQKSQEFICKEFDTLRNECKNIVTENAALAKKCEYLEGSYLKLNARLNQMEAQLDIPLQRELAKNVIICGLRADIPEIENCISDTIKQVSRDGKIIKIQKMNHNSNTKSTLRGSFILTLNSIEVKNDVLSKFKMIQKNSNSSSSKLAGCYVMQHFTRFQSRLYNEARKLQQTHNFKYLWAKDGKIFMRRTADSKIFHIFSMNDIFRLDEICSPLHVPSNDDT